MRNVRGHRPPGDQDQGQTLGPGEAFSSKYDQIHGEIKHGAEDVRHDPADEPPQASKHAERQNESQIMRDSLLWKEGSHYKPYDVSGQDSIEAYNGPWVDVPMERQNAETIDERASAIVRREFVQEHRPGDESAVFEIGHRIRVQQRIAVVERGPGHEERSNQDRAASANCIDTEQRHIHLDFLFDLAIRKDCTTGLPSYTLIGTCSPGPLGQRIAKTMRVSVRTSLPLLKGYQQQTIE